MLYEKSGFNNILHCIECDPFSWRGVSFFYLRLYSGASGDEADYINLPNALSFKGKNNDYIFLKKKSEDIIPPDKAACSYFWLADISSEWQQVCSIIRAAIAKEDNGSKNVEQKTDNSPPYSILIVEDDPMTSQMIAHQLKKFGSITATSNSREATANYMVHRPDLVFLDIHYHNDNADGFDVLKSIISADADAFIVMVSGDRSLSRVLEALQLGAQGFISKPFQADDFAYYFAKFHQLRRRV